MIRIDSYEQLEALLRNWQSFGAFSESAYAYDFVGMVALLAACLDNLQANSVEDELEDIGGCFNDSQRAFLKKIAEYL